MFNIRNGILLGLMTISKMVSALLIGKVLAIYHGAIGIGFAGQIQGIAGLTSGLLSAPLGNGLVKSIAQHEKNESNETVLIYWVNSVFTSILIGILISIFLFAIIIKKPFSSLPLALLLTAFSISPFQTICTAFQSILNGLGKIKELSLLGILSIIISTITSIIAIIKLNLVSGLIVSSMSIIFQSIIFILFFKSSHWISSLFNKKLLKNIQISSDVLIFSAMAIVSALVVPGSQIYIRSFLANIYGWEFTGYWQAAQRLSDAHLTLLGSITSTQLLPIFYKSKIELHKKIIIKYMFFCVGILLPGAIILYIFKNNIIKLLFSQSLLISAQIVIYQIIGDSFRAMSWPASYSLIAQKKLFVFSASEIVFSASWIGSIIFLSNQFGWHAASIGYLFASLSNLIFLSSYTFLKKN